MHSKVKKKSRKEDTLRKAQKRTSWAIGLIFFGIPTIIIGGFGIVFVQLAGGTNLSSDPVTGLMGPVSSGIILLGLIMIVKGIILIINRNK